ncbi:hypothetical protein LTR17_016897 [Elasticomyces elasticus]|nr:hypothetical protein LTR17_016897 [Elasticomyces elasticus]
MCHFYLSDVASRATDLNVLTRETDGLSSEWFRRGLTLQELLAPRVLIFWAKDWQYIATLAKNNPDAIRMPFVKVLVKHTGIPAEYLITGRMSWMADRTTTHVEDIAYCLLGLFQVDLPPLYGEGTRAFIRLQKAIIEQSDDESIFAWRVDTDHERTREWSDVHHYCHRRGILASSPSDFRNCGRIIADQHNARLPYRITNKGLEILARAVKIGDPHRQQIYHIRLSCFVEIGGRKQPCSIAVRCLQDRIGGTGHEGSGTGGIAATGRAYTCNTNVKYIKDRAVSELFFIELIEDGFKDFYNFKKQPPSPDEESG